MQQIASSIHNERCLSVWMTIGQISLVTRFNTGAKSHKLFFDPHAAYILDSHRTWSQKENSRVEKGQTVLLGKIHVARLIGWWRNILHGSYAPGISSWKFNSTLSDGKKKKKTLDGLGFTNPQGARYSRYIRVCYVFPFWTFLKMTSVQSAKVVAV